MSYISHRSLYSDLFRDIDQHQDDLDRTTSSVDLSLLGDHPYSSYLTWNGKSTDHLTVDEFACMQLLQTFLKKFQDGHSTSADKAALDKFIASNIRCGEWSLDDDRSLETDLLIGLFKQEIYRFFNRGSSGHILSDLGTIFKDGTVGPGSSVGSNGTDFYTKLFSGPLTGTSKSLYAIYAHKISNIPHWSHAEIQRSDEYGEFGLVKGNRLSFVPKNVDTSRCICTEPLLNMFFQQGVKYGLERRLRQYFGIDLADQQLCNKDLARIGSMNEKYCTVDLSSASDTVSLRMIEETFPADVVDWLKLFRSPEVRLPNGEWMDLKMISSMGNAFTFPLETIIFSCVVSAAYRMKEISLRKGYGSSCKYEPETGAFSSSKRMPNFGVFGDDIIVLKECHRHTVMLLNTLGFTVNAEKSFDKGPFRESCGGDYFRGHPVRGVYIKTLKTQASRYVAINRLNAWSALHGVCLKHTVRRLLKTVRYLPVPLYENDDAGIKVPFSMVKNLRMDRDTQSIKYRRWCSKQQKIAIKDGALKLPRGQKHRIFNADGLLLAFLRGDVRNDAFGSRLGVARYHSKEAICPNWDWLPPVIGSVALPFGQKRLADAVIANLTS
jgi:hypothetical protein